MNHDSKHNDFEYEKETFSSIYGINGIRWY